LFGILRRRSGTLLHNAFFQIYIAEITLVSCGIEKASSNKKILSLIGFVLHDFQKFVLCANE
jgi:hypothetical protein